MVFHVAGPHDIFGVGRVALEFREHGAERLVHEIGQHVQPPAMGHADHQFAQAKLAAAFDDLFERRDQGFTALQPEALGTGVFPVEELFEDFDAGEDAQNGFLAAPSELGVVALALDAFLNPGLFFWPLDVHELDADIAAIGRADNINDLAHRRGFQPEHIVDENRAVQIGLGKPIGLGVEFRMGLGLHQTQRVEIRFQMAAHTVGADQHQGADRI